MAYVFKFYAIYWVIALIGGVLIGLLTWQNRQRPGWFSGWTAWATVLFLIGCVVALLKLIAGRRGHYLELGLIFFAAYIIGCWLGSMLRALFAPAREDMRSQPVSPPAMAMAGAGAAPRTMAPATAPPVTSVAPVAAALPAGPKPAGLTSPRNGKADDLKRVRGIGRQNEERLHGLGVYHFDQIAGWSKENVEWVGDFLAFPGRIEREDWVGQAKQLAAGQETDFSRRVTSGAVPTSLDAAGAAALAAKHPGDKPAGLAGPRAGTADDLKRVSGIGRQNEERLNGLGIFHFDQIAGWTKDNVEWVGDFMAFPGRIEREKWVEQASDLAAGRETEFSKRVASGDVPTSQKKKP